MLDGKRTYITETKATVPQATESQVTGKLTISNQTSNGFDVVVTNVSGGGKEVKEVRVPIWSDKNGQDDLTWYHADKQSDGSYKINNSALSDKESSYINTINSSGDIQAIYEHVKENNDYLLRTDDTLKKFQSLYN